MSSTALHSQLLVLATGRSKSKINDLDHVVVILIHYNVVHLQVTVHNIDAVHITYGTNYLLKDAGCLWL